MDYDLTDISNYNNDIVCIGKRVLIVVITTLCKVITNWDATGVKNICSRIPGRFFLPHSIPLLIALVVLIYHMR